MNPERSLLRHELKFFINRGGAAIVKSRLGKICYPDPHAKGFEPYFIRSLYFDDADLSAYRDKIAGVDDRIKYRVRFYNMDPSFVAFEKKKKNGEFIEKTSVRIDENAMRAMAAGRVVGAEDGLVREYDILVKNRFLRPLVLVDYDRTVFSYPIGDTRITVDENVRARRFEGELFSTPASIPVLERGEAVLEVKFSGLLPAQIECLLTDIPKTRSAVSKYCLSCAYL
ncbi:MAG: polyphosphate polymerase domain-containing protein [Clostridia bacterium]|nr:polyphosphate polymerase domain-containing protein [Clostridia bacterium]